MEKTKMKIKNLIIALFLLLALLSPQNSFTQPLQTGQAVMTFYHQNGYSVGVIDTRVRPEFQLPNIGVNWGTAPFSYHPSWQQNDLGTVFGIAIDNNRNIFISATSTYRELSPEFGPAGEGGIYVLDDATWQATPFMNTFPGPVWNSNPNQIPNTGPSLGNVAYDKYNNQLFVTNFEDGKIYRLNILPSGTTVIGSIAEIYDPLPSNNDITAGYAPLGDRVWGIGITKDPVSNIVRLYYSVWVENFQAIDPSGSNRIGRVELNASGSVNAATNNNALINMPSWGTTQYSNPVSDIEFSLDNKRMIVAERTMESDVMTAAHQSRVIEYALDITGNWIQEPLTKFRVGQHFSQENASGGVDYEYLRYDTITNQMSVCDSVVWMTGHALRFGAGNYVYGLQGTLASGGNYSTSILIDADMDLSEWNNDKNSLGDVDILRNFDCFDAPVDTACMTILRDSVYCDSTGNGYYYSFTVKNNSFTKSITELEFTVDSPQPPNTVFVNPGFILPVPPIPPQGVSQNYVIHLTGPGTDTCEQFVCFTLSATLDFVDCPTCCFIEKCIKLPCCEGCGSVSGDSIYCVNGLYYFTFTVTNQSGFTVNKIQLTSPIVGGPVFVPSNITGLNIPDGGSTTQTVQLLNGTAGQTYPVRFKLFWGTTDCCYFEKNYTLPPCGQIDTCSCGQWEFRHYKIGTDTLWRDLSCNTSIGVPSNAVFNLTGNILCNPADTNTCNDTYEIRTTNLSTNTTVSTIQSGALNYSLTVDNNYQIRLSSYCGGRLCDTCVFIIKKSSGQGGRVRTELMQNYPNPFNPSTQISFYLPFDAKVSVRIYNITGQLVATLINNELRTAGIQSVAFDASGLASGIYFYRLDSDNFSDTKKMLFVK